MLIRSITSVKEKKGQRGGMLFPHSIFPFTVFLFNSLNLYLSSLTDSYCCFSIPLSHLLPVSVSFISLSQWRWEIGSLTCSIVCDVLLIEASFLSGGELWLKPSDGKPQPTCLCKHNEISYQLQVLLWKFRKCPAHFSSTFHI